MLDLDFWHAWLPVIWFPIGIGLGLRLRVYSLLPATLLAVTIGVAIGWVFSKSGWGLIAGILMAVVLLQVGYLLGLAASEAFDRRKK